MIIHNTENAYLQVMAASAPFGHSAPFVHSTPFGLSAPFGHCTLLATAIFLPFFGGELLLK